MERILIRGNFISQHPVATDNMREFYAEMQKIMEEEYLDYGDIRLLHWPIKTKQHLHHDHNSGLDKVTVVQEEEIEIQVAGPIGSLLPDDEDIRIRHRLSTFMCKWKISSMFFCWSRAEFDETFKPKEDDNLDDTEQDRTD